MSAKSTFNTPAPDFQTLKQALKDATLTKSGAQFASLAPLEPEITELLKRGYRQKEIMAILATHKFVISKSTFSRFVKKLDIVPRKAKTANQSRNDENQTNVLSEFKSEKKLSPDELTAVMQKQPDLKQLDEDARNLLRNR